MFEVCVAGCSVFDCVGWDDGTIQLESMSAQDTHTSRHPTMVPAAKVHWKSWEKKRRVRRRMEEELEEEEKG